MQERKCGESIPKEKKLGLPDLVKKFDSSGYHIIEHEIPSSMAMQKVAKMNMIFTSSKSPLKLSTMPTETYEEQLQLWNVAKKKYESKKKNSEFNAV